MSQINPMTTYEAPHIAELEAIAKRIGYGRACQILGDLWDRMLEREYGRPSSRGKMERRRDIEEIEALLKSRATQPASESTTSDADKLRRLRDGLGSLGWCAEFGALAMEVLREPSATTAQQNSKSGLAAQVAAAQAEQATWSESRRSGVQLEGGDQAEDKGD